MQRDGENREIEPEKWAKNKKGCPMRIALPLKGKASQIFAGPVFDAEKQSAIIPIRHMKFDFEAEKIDPKFYLNAELASAYFASLSIFLTYGEE